MGVIFESFGVNFGIVFGPFWNIFHFLGESSGNGPGTFLGYSLIVPGYIQPIPGLFSEIFENILFPLYFPIFSYVYIYIAVWGSAAGVI